MRKISSKSVEKSSLIILTLRRVQNWTVGTIHGQKKRICQVQRAIFAFYRVPSLNSLRIVVHIANDPVQMALPTFIPMDVRQNKFNGSAAIVTEIPLFYPNPLAVEDHTFDAFDSNKMYEAGEFFTFKCNAEQLDQPDTVDQVEVNWTRVSKFAPFMKMGGKDGYLVYHCTGYKLPQGATADDLDALLAKEIKDVVPEYATADEYNPDAQNVSSWSYFKKHFDRYQHEPEATWPIPSKE